MTHFRIGASHVRHLITAFSWLVLLGLIGCDGFMIPVEADAVSMPESP